MMTMENPALAVLVGFLTSFVGNVCATETGLAPKVQLGVFVETLCPACAHFTKEQLPKLFVNNISDIFDLSLIPWVRFQRCSLHCFATTRVLHLHTNSVQLHDVYSVHDVL